MGLVFCSQIFTVWLTGEVSAGYKEDGEVMPWYWSYIFGIINTIFIVIFGNIWGTVSASLVKNENHRYKQSYENSMINKTYMFQFINNYLGNFFAIFYAQNFASLSVNLMTIMIGKQIILNVVEYWEERTEV